MKVNKSYKFRLYPTELQERLLLQHVGNSRFVWNKLVEFNAEFRDENNKFPSQFVLQQQIVKLKSEFEFTRITHSQPLQINAKRLVQANLNSIQPETIQGRKLKTAKAKNKPVKFRDKALARALSYGFPNFKKKSDMNGNLFYPQNFKIKGSRISFGKLGSIKFIKHRQIDGKPKTATIMQDGCQWNISICCETDIEEQPMSSIDSANIVGVDVGIKEFAVLSDGNVIHNSKTLKKHLAKLKKEQKRLSRKQFVDKTVNGKTRKISSNNRMKQKEKVRRIHRKVRNTRKDFLHKTTHDMITKYDGIMIETLSIKDMLQNNDKNQNRNTCDVSWYEFATMLEYKCLWNSKYFHKIDQYFASSQFCSECGNKQEMPLKKRTYLCESCGARFDRDFNASLNILNEGISHFRDSTTAGTAGSYACEQAPLGAWTKQEQRETCQAVA